MAAIGGKYDDPNYVTRQNVVLGVTAITASGTSLYFTPPSSSLRVRKVSGTVIAAGTGTAGSNGLTILNGTTSIGGLAMGTSSIGTPVISSDCNATLASGTCQTPA